MAPAISLAGICRRTLLKGGGAVAVVAVAWPAVAAGPAATLHVYDVRLASGQASAAAAQAAGTRTCAIDGDVTAVWRDDLARRWRADRAAAVTGVTSPRSLHCLQVMAAGTGVALVERRALGGGAVAWRLAAPGAMA